MMLSSQPFFTYKFMYYFLNTLGSFIVAFTFSFILTKKGKAKEERGGNIIVKKKKSKGTKVAHTHTQTKNKRSGD